MKPAARFLLSGLVLVVALTAAASAGVVWCVHRAADERMLERFKVAGIVGADLQAQQLETLQLRAQLLASDPAFVDYVAQSLIPNPQTGTVDSLSISELLTQRRHGYDVAMVLDPLGKPVSSSGLLTKDRASIPHDTLVTTSIRELKPVQGTWLDNGQLLWVVASPLLRGNTLEGVLITATRVNDAFAATVGRTARSHVALLAASGGSLLPLSNSGLDVRVLDLLSRQSASILAASSTSGQIVPIRDGSQVITTWVTPLRASDAQIALVALDHQGDGENRNLPAEAASLLLGVWVLGAIAALCVLVQWQTTWRPLQQV
ncbi:MAG TPA: hypothetical protein VMA74_20485, partial [Dyella sp.]|uniref:hypothetical protein n=1 Tax=Dyella sp. TaxID=1869338 RepID=UPI002CF753AA